MLLQSLLAAYGSTRKEEVASVGKYHHHQRCKVCRVTSSVHNWRRSSWPKCPTISGWLILLRKLSQSIRLHKLKRPIISQFRLSIQLSLQLYENTVKILSLVTVYNCCNQLKCKNWRFAVAVYKLFSSSLKQVYFWYLLVPGICLQFLFLKWPLEVLATIMWHTILDNKWSTGKL